MGPPLLQGFRDVDAARSPASLMEYLVEVSESPYHRARMARRLAGSGIAPGMRVADLGCGVGSDTLMLARHVGPSGRVIGLDLSRAMVEFARGRAEAAILPVEFLEGDVVRLPLPDRGLDAVWVERLLVHAADPAAALAEIRRVLRPGGIAVLGEADYRSVVVDGADREVSDGVAAGFVASLRNPWIGSALPRLARQAGFGELRVEAEAALISEFEFAAGALRWRESLSEMVARGEATEARAEAWWHERQEAAQAGVLTAALTFFVTHATR